MQLSAMTRSLRKRSSRLALSLVALLPAIVLAACPPDWQEGASYSAGQEVVYQGHLYQALVSHTAYVGAGWNPSVASLWQDLGATDCSGGSGDTSGGTGVSGDTGSSGGSGGTSGGSSSSDQGPFNDAQVQLPGTLEAENYDYGGFYDSTSGNAGGVYRQDDVDIEAASQQGYNIGWITSGEWLEYSVSISQAGSYQLASLVSSKANGGQFQLSLDGGKLTTVTVPVTGGWQSWKWVNSSLNLPAGNHVIRVTATRSGYNFNALKFSLESGSGGGASSGAFNDSPAQIPGTLEAEKYDYGGYHDSTNGNAGGAYRQDDVDIQAASQNGYNIGWIATGEWLQYSVQVNTAGAYQVASLVSSKSNGGQFKLSLDGNSLATVNVPVTGGWQTWQWVNSSVNLSAGAHVLKVSVTQDGFNLNAIKFSLASSGGSSGGASSGGGGTRQATYFTSYGYNDNDDGNGHYGTAVIAYPTSQHPIATEGSGTYNDPVSFATDEREIPPHTIIYVPYLQKYFVMDDGCVECTQDWNNGRKWRTDLFMGPNNALQPASALEACEEKITRNDVMYINAGPGYPVDTTPLFSNGKCTVRMH